MLNNSVFNQARNISVLHIIMTRFWFKMFGSMGFTLIFFIAYLYLLHHPVFPVFTMPITWLDQQITFQPWAVSPYVSLWCYVSLPPMLMLDRREIITYGLRMALVCLIGLTIFFFWPNAVPPADIDWVKYPSVSFLKQVDMSGNACPSLHVATSVFTAIWLFWRMRMLNLGWVVQLVNVVWCLAIVYSTMAIKQHVALDVLAGTALAVLCAQLTRLKWHAAQDVSGARLAGYSTV